MSRTLTLNCPRCGQEVDADVSRAQIEVLEDRIDSLTGYVGHRMIGLSAEVRLDVDHRCGESR